MIDEGFTDAGRLKLPNTVVVTAKLAVEEEEGVDEALDDVDDVVAVVDVGMTWSLGRSGALREVEEAVNSTSGKIMTSSPLTRKTEGFDRKNSSRPARPKNSWT